MTTEKIGLLVLMLNAMVYDVVQWACILMVLTWAFAVLFFHYLSGRKNKVAECAEEGLPESLFPEGEAQSVWVLLKIALAAADPPLECLESSKMIATAMACYMIIAIILLLNMLIAMMAKTFDTAWENMSDNYNMMRASLVFRARDVPLPPVTLFRHFRKNALNLIGAMRARTCKRREGPSKTAPSEQNYQTLEEQEMPAVAAAEKEEQSIHLNDELTLNDLTPGRTLEVRLPQMNPKAVLHTIKAALDEQDYETNPARFKSEVLNKLSKLEKKLKKAETVASDVEILNVEIV